jgi:hypothetical protein
MACFSVKENHRGFILLYLYGKQRFITVLPGPALVLILSQTNPTHDFPLYFP